MTRGKYEGYEKKTQNFVFESMVSQHLRDLGADKMLILKFIIPKWYGNVKLLHWWVILTQ